MPRFRYVGPLDGIDIPLLRLVDVRPGDEFDATAAQAELLAAQPDNYEPVDDDATAIAAAVLEPTTESEPEVPALDTDPAPADAADPAQEG